MAREKIRNSTENETVKEDQEQPPSPTNRSMHAPLKKKGSQKRMGDQEPDGMSHELVGRKGSGGSSGSGFGYSGSKSTFHRSNKTLAWFMTDELLTTTDSHPTKNNCTNSSSDLSTITTDMKETVEDKKRSKRIRQKPQKKVVEMKQRTDSTSNSEDSHDSKPPPKGENGKDDYWYYDPTSDGFYYEKTGSRGWRRRIPVNVQKRVQHEQDMYAACSRDPQQMAYFQAGLYGYGPDMTPFNAAYYAAPQIRYYDPASDGYFFEMPSVDGWKRRQPHPSSAPPHSNSMRFGMMPSPFMQHQPQVTSYGAALARGQLPPAYTLANSVICSQEPFSSGTSSMSTASSLSEGNPSPPPNYNSKDSLFQSDEDLDDFLAQQYDHALQIEELTKDDDNEVLCQIKEQPTPIIRKPVTYANVAATSYDSDDVENRPPTKDSDLKRPGSLPLQASEEAQKKRDGHELLLNFNADKFIADIANHGLDAERVLCDLASLKTPVTSSAACGLGSPQTPAIYSAFPNWARSLDSHNPNDWWADDANNAFLNKIWSQDSSSSSKSKLSMWCEAGVRTAVPVDNH